MFNPFSLSFQAKESFLVFNNITRAHVCLGMDLESFRAELFIAIKKLPSFGPWLSKPAFLSKFGESQTTLRKAKFWCKSVTGCQFCLGWERTSNQPWRKGALATISWHFKHSPTASGEVKKDDSLLPRLQPQLLTLATKHLTMSTIPVQ